MANFLSALFDLNKPSPPDPSVYRPCESCGYLTNQSSIAWPKEKTYRFVCNVCMEKRKEESMKYLKNALDHMRNSEHD